jgi:protein-tyrosine phosphatase
MMTAPATRTAFDRVGLNVNRVSRRLYQGARPAPEQLRQLGRFFGLVVFCAEEYQPSAESFAPAQVLHCPLNDDGSPMLAAEWDRARATAVRVAAAVHAGVRVLVTCHQGRNRSGLVSALALRGLTGWPGERCIATVRAARPHALLNQYFLEALRRLK